MRPSKKSRIRRMSKVRRTTLYNELVQLLKSQNVSDETTKRIAELRYLLNKDNMLRTTPMLNKRRWRRKVSIKESK